MPRWTKILLKVAGILLSLVIVSWLAIAGYVQTHKKQLLTSITSQLNENLTGILKIEKMEPALIRGFPGISVTLTNVVLRDSLWTQHKHDVLNAKEAYVSIDAFSILSGSPTIKNISIHNGQLYFYTDSLGYSNTDLYKKSDPGKEANDVKKKKINRIDLFNVKFILQNDLKSKFFDFNISHFNGKVNYNSTGWKAKADLDTRINRLEFNTSRGSFLKNTNLQSSLEMSFDDKTHTLTVPVQAMKIGGDDFEVGGKFALGKGNSAFALDVKTKSISLESAEALLLPKVKLRLKRYTLKQPFSAGASIRGMLRSGKDPKINAYWKVQDNTLTFDKEVISDCSFEGKYYNEVVKGEGFKDPNSAINLYGMKGKWYGIPFTADSITITDLKKPVLAGKFLADFPLKQLNSVFGNETFSFSRGTAHVDLIYKAPYFSTDKSQRFINGSVQVKGASLNYLPRNLPFSNVHAHINFRGQDLFLTDINMQSGGSSLQMEGTILNFLNLFYTDPQKMLLDWHISSPQINLGQFMSFLGKRKSGRGIAGNTGSFSKQLDRMLNEASVKMALKVDKLIYKRFVAQNVQSNITLKEQGISVNNVSLRHAGGTLAMNGDIDQSGKVNKVRLNTSIREANIQQLFYAFNNFGQTTLSDQNLRGTFNADCKITGSLRDDGNVVPHSVRGTVDFTLKNGALVNFEAMEKVGDFAFPNRDFSNITLKTVSNTFTLLGNSVVIPPMQIESSVLNIFLQGVYGFTTGTDIAMQVPLRNPKKDDLVFDEQEKQQRAKRGIVINLRAIDGEDGKVKIKLGKE
jgi:hypothetical protein